MYKIDEKEDNKDIFTSVVRVKSSDKYRVVPVKSSEKVDINIWRDLSKVLGRIYVSLPINVGDIICKNILNTGVDIICTRDLSDE